MAAWSLLKKVGDAHKKIRQQSIQGENAAFGPHFLWCVGNAWVHGLQDRRHLQSTAGI